MKEIGTPQFVTPLAAHKSCGTPLLMYLWRSNANTQNQMLTLQRHIYRSSTL
jgi:hypothetical protein